jgi:putative nucleotidyltransferase with HDIG domain
MEYLIALLDTNYVYDEDQGGDIYSGLISLKLGRYREQITNHIHTDLVLDRAARPLLYLGALYHDITKPEHRTVEEDGRIRFIGHEESGAKAISQRGHKLHLSNSEIMRLKSVVRNHMRPWQLAKDDKLPSRRSIYRFWRATEEAGIDICLLSIADLLAIYGHTLPQDMLEHHLDVVRALLEAYWEMEEEVVHPPAVVDGKELIKALKLKTGPMVGEILEAIREAQAVGEIETKGDALEFAERWVRERK